jgi:hypothetical protein
VVGRSNRVVEDKRKRRRSSERKQSLPHGEPSELGHVVRRFATVPIERRPLIGALAMDWRFPIVDSHKKLQLDSSLVRDHDSISGGR